MKKITKLRYYIAYLIGLVAILSSVFGRGLHLLLFVFPLFMSYLFRKNGRVVLRRKEGNIIAGLMTLVFIPLFFSQDVFIMALYYLLGLLSIKLFVSFTEKDYDHVSLLGFLSFSMSTVFLYSVWYVILYVFFALLVTFYLFVRIIPDDTALNKSSIQYVSLVFPAIILSSVVLFFILPRNPYMFFGANTGSVGGDFGTLKVGGFEKEELSSRVLFRVKPLSAVNEYIYVRSRVFTQFDGREWNTIEKWGKNQVEKVNIGKNPGFRSRKYTFFPVTRFRYVPLVEYPVLLLWQGASFAVFADLMEVRVRKWPKKGEFTVYALSSPTIPFSFRNYSDYLEVPESLRENLLQIMHNIDFSEDTLSSIVSFLKKHYAYGRFVPRMDSLSPVLEFLLHGKRGECTEFATSFVLFARLLGYKTRMVAGFLTKEFNPLGRYFVVREKHAHAWAEVFKNGRWVRYDPTPCGSETKSIINKLQEYYDFIQYIWFTRVVEYSYHNQMKIALKLMPYYWKLRAKTVKKFVLFVILGVVTLFLVLYVLFGVVLVPLEQKAVNKFLRYMRKQGFERKKGETLMELAKRSCDPKAIDFVKEYYIFRFGTGAKERLRRAIKSL